MTKTYQVAYQFLKFLAHTFLSYRVVNPEKMIESGPAILAMNHVSFVDPPLAGLATNRQLAILARRSLLDWPIIGRILPNIGVIPVNRGGVDMTALKKLVRVIKDGGATLLFPEGTRSKDGNLQRGQAGVGLIIAKTLAPVVPMRIFGAYEAFPRNGRFRPTPCIVVVGDPIYFTEEDLKGASSNELYQRLSDRVMEAIAEIKDPRDQTSSGLSSHGRGDRA